MKLPAVLAVTAALFIYEPATAETPPCVARAELEPGSAVVGQQVLWKVQIDSRDDVAEISWVETPAFANIRTEALPGLPITARAESDGSRRYTVQQERRALFAERVGHLLIASAGLHCKLSNGKVLATAVPAVTLTVVPIAAANRPEEFSGLIGPLVLQTHVEPDEIALGETIHVTVSIRGAGNLWDVEDPLRGWNPVDTDIFAHNATLELRTGSRLSVQKIFRYDVVPRKAGRFAVPPVQLPYFEPLQARYAVGRSAAIDVLVGPRRPHGDLAQRDASRPTLNPSDSGVSRSEDPDASPPARIAMSLTLWLGILLGIVLTVGAGVRLWFRRRRSRAIATPRATGEPDRDAAELVHALRSAIAMSATSSTSSTSQTEHMAEAVALMEALERSRFDPNTDAPDRERVERALVRLGGTTSRDPRSARS